MSRLPDGGALPSTRAELLVLQRDRTTALEKSYFRGGILVPGRGRRLHAELEAWRRIDRTRAARALPPGDIDATVASIHDARDSAELEEVIRTTTFAKQVRITALDLVGIAMLAVIPFMVGLVVALLAIAVVSAGARIALVVIGVLIMAPSMVIWWATSVESFRRQQEFNAVGVEATLYRARRKTLTGVEARAEQVLPVWARPAAGVIGGLLIVILGLRIRRADPIALVIAAAILVILALLAVIPLLRRRSLHVIPLLEGGGTVLDRPTRWVSLDVDSAGLHIRPTKDGVEGITIPVTDIVGIVPVKVRYPFAAESIGILTREAPVVLSGSGVSEDPAIEMVRNRLG